MSNWFVFANFDGLLSSHRSPVHQRSQQRSPLAHSFHRNVVWSLWFVDKNILFSTYFISLTNLYKSIIHLHGYFYWLQILLVFALARTHALLTRVVYFMSIGKNFVDIWMNRTPSNHSSRQNSNKFYLLNRMGRYDVNRFCVRVRTCWWWWWWRWCCWLLLLSQARL